MSPVDRSSNIASHLSNPPAVWSHLTPSPPDPYVVPRDC